MSQPSYTPKIVHTKQINHHQRNNFNRLLVSPRKEFSMIKGGIILEIAKLEIYLAPINPEKIFVIVEMDIFSQKEKRTKNINCKEEMV